MEAAWNAPWLVLAQGSSDFCKSTNGEGDFEKVAYALEISSPNSPKYAEVKTNHGYHIIMVEGRK